PRQSLAELSQTSVRPRSHRGGAADQLSLPLQPGEGRGEGAPHSRLAEASPRQPQLKHGPILPAQQPQFTTQIPRQSFAKRKSQANTRRRDRRLVNRLRKRLKQLPPAFG